MTSATAFAIFVRTFSARLDEVDTMVLVMWVESEST